MISTPIPFFTDFAGVPITIPAGVFNDRTDFPFTFETDPSGRWITMSNTVPAWKAWFVLRKSPCREKSLDILLNVKLLKVNSTSQRLINLFCCLLFARFFPSFKTDIIYHYSIVMARKGQQVGIFLCSSNINFSWFMSHGFSFIITKKRGYISAQAPHPAHKL
jgi:hypothetical protein